MELFTKEKSLDHIINIMQSNPSPKISEGIEIFKKIQNYLQEIYDFGFSEGFEKCVIVTKNINEL